ncbi:MAG: glycosyltransferase family 4 protein [Bacteroidales bacterium]|nr:glycosyltransferase family 4 protein [Bacteroidales bacterium]
MKIAIEAQRIFRKNKHGMDFVILEIIKELQKMDTQNEYYIFVKPGEDTCLTSSGNVRVIEIKCPFYVFWEQIALPGAVRKIKPDILHCTSSTAPLSNNVPLILTLHDIIFMGKKYAGSKSFYQALGRRYRRHLLPRILPKCKKIITVSNSEKQYILEQTKITPEQLTVVYNACSSRFRILDDYRMITQKYIDDESYILFLGNTDPKKNTLRVLKAYDLYIQQSENPLPLLILDIKEKHIDTFLKEAGIDRQIKKMLRLCDYVPNKDMPYIYNGAQVFLYPSLHESFGIPILEAMSCGVPVITSNVSSMPEIGEDAALYVNPFHPEEISDQLLFLESHPEEREKMIGRGLQRRKAFSWERSAQEVLEVYENVYCTLN